MTTPELAALVRSIPDFPKPGILFRDITPLLAEPRALGTLIDKMAELLADLGATRIVGIESRGFLFGTPLAVKLGIGFAPVRKPGKLPWKKRAVSYALEYGSDTLELHEDAVHGQRVVIVDDLLATGGTARAAADLCTTLGGQVVGYAFVIELAGLAGRLRLADAPVKSLLQY